MAAFVAFVGMLLLSLVASLIAALQLADFFGAGDEFLLVLAWITGFGVLALVLFATAYWQTPNLGVLNVLALGLALTALLPAVVPGFAQKIAERSTNPYTVGVEDTYIRLELVIPSLIAVLVQWGLVRGRWLRAAGDEDLSLWPWITTVVGGLVILNPFGLTFLTTVIRHVPNDPSWQISAIVTAVTLAALLVMAWTECYIRGRILDRLGAVPRASRDAARRSK